VPAPCSAAGVAVCVCGGGGRCWSLVRTWGVKGGEEEKYQRERHTMDD
jgi:hypothetical protein